METAERRLRFRHALFRWLPSVWLGETLVGSVFTLSSCLFIHRNLTSTGARVASLRVALPRPRNPTPPPITQAQASEFRVQPRCILHAPL